MANKLSFDKKALAVSMLCEGSSIRGIERMTGIHRDTIMRLGVRMVSAQSGTFAANYRRRQRSGISGVYGRGNEDVARQGGP